MNERDYGVGIANRYALFMGEEGADPLSDVVRSPKGKENKQQDKAAAGKKAQPAAAPAVSKGASSKSAAGPAVSPAAPRTNNTSATGTGPKQSAAPAAGGPAVKSVQKDGKPQAAAGAQQQVKQRQPQSQVTSDQSSGQTVRSGPRPEERQRPAAAGIGWNGMKCMLFNYEPVSGTCARCPCTHCFPAHLFPPLTHLYSLCS